MDYITQTLRESIKKIITENRESKNINLARKYLKSKGYNDSKAQMILNVVRTDVPNSRLAQCKFLLGVVRLYIGGQLGDGTSIQTINKLLPYIASDAHINEYDNNLNGISLSEINNRFSALRKQDSELSRKNSYSKQHKKNNNYRIVRITDFEKASKYGQYTSWCVTHDEDMYYNYTNDGIGLFYFCLRTGFKNVERVKGENAPLDEYGLSMIAVSVDEIGDINTITCRWNHEMEGNDHIMSKDELEDLLGVNFYEAFKPYSDEELIEKGYIPIPKVRKMLSNGTNIYYIFKSVRKLSDKILICNNRNGNLIIYNTETKQIPKWMNKSIEDVEYFNEGFAKISMDGMYSFIDDEGNLIGNGKAWFDDVSNFSNGFACVHNEDKWSFINREGNLLGNGNLWFDDVFSFKNGFAKVELNGKASFIDTNGKLIGDGNVWFDWAGSFNNGFALIMSDYEYSFINQEGRLIYDGKIWFDDVSEFKNGFAIVKSNDKYSLISNDFKLIENGKLWFDYIEQFYNGFFSVELNGKYSLINKYGKLIENGKLWFNHIYMFSDGFAKIENGGKSSFIDTDGNLIGNGNLWFDYAGIFNNGFAPVEMNGIKYLIDKKGIFYDYNTKQPININKSNEQFSRIGIILRECINNYLSIK